MKTNSFCIFILLTILLAGCHSGEKPVSLVDFMDPTIGNVGHLLQPTRPTVQLPNQMIRMHPVRADYLDDQIDFFPLTISSHRQPPLFGVLPGTGNPNAGNWKNRQTYDHDLEVTKPHYYSTYLIDEDITAEFVPGAKTGFFTFTFPEEKNKKLKFNLIHHGEWNIVTENTIKGIEAFEGMKAFVYGEFNQNTQFNLEVNNQKPTLWADFSSTGPVEFKYGISFIDLKQAKRNLENEIPEWDFDDMKT